MKTRASLFLATVLASVLFTSATVSFGETIPSFSDASNSSTLQDLSTNGGSLTIGDLTFSNFSFFESGLTNFDPSQIHVTATLSNGTYFLTWDGNMSLVSPNGGGATSADLVLKYSVTAARGAIDAIDAAFTGSGQPANGTFIAVDESARDSSGTIVGTTHLDSQHNNSTFPIRPPQRTLDVTKDVTFATTNGGLVTLSEIAQSFHPIPEPSTTALVGGAMGLLVLYRGLARTAHSRRRE